MFEKQFYQLDCSAYVQFILTLVLDQIYFQSFLCQHVFIHTPLPIPVMLFHISAVKMWGSYATFHSEIPQGPVMFRNIRIY